MRIPGTTGSDKHLRFVDDGLEIKYAGLMQQLQDVGDEIYQATELLPSAQAEIAFSERWWRSPRFPVQTYAFVFRCASNITSRTCGAAPVSEQRKSRGSIRIGAHVCTPRRLEMHAIHCKIACGNASESPIRAQGSGSFRCATNILTTLLAIVTTLHDGSVRLGLCVRHHDLMDDVRQDITTAFTALAGIIHKSVSGQETESPACSCKALGLFSGRAIILARP